jgi:dUTP pyrophosphatase
MQIRVKKLTDTARLPSRGSREAAGYDLYADLKEDVVIRPHTTVMIGTGLAMEIPPGYFGAIFARSGLALKESLRPANCVGVVDSDYRGPFMIALHNDGDTDRVVTDGERIAQMVVVPYLEVGFEVAEELQETERGEGGFGSTGTD